MQVMFETEPTIITRTPRQLFDEVVEASHYGRYAVGHEPSPALAVYMEVKSIPEGVNLVKGLADYLRETTPEIEEDEALAQALQSIDTIGKEDKPWGYVPTSPQMQHYDRKIDLWRQVSGFFRLEAEAKAQLNS